MRPRTSWVTLAWPTMSWATIAAILLATLSVVVTPALSTADRAAFRHPRHLLHLRALVALRSSRGYRGHSRPARRCPGALDVVADQFSRRRSAHDHSFHHRGERCQRGIRSLFGLPAERPQNPWTTHASNQGHGRHRGHGESGLHASSFILRGKAQFRRTVRPIVGSFSRGLILRCRMDGRPWRISIRWFASLPWTDRWRG